MVTLHQGEITYVWQLTRVAFPNKVSACDRRTALLGYDGFLRSYFGKSRHQLLARAAHEPSVKWVTEKRAHRPLNNRRRAAAKNEAAAPVREDGFLRSYFGQSRQQILSRAAHEASMQWLADIKSHRLTTNLQSAESQEQHRRTAQRVSALRTIEEPSSEGMLKDLDQLKARAFGCVRFEGARRPSSLGSSVCLAC